MPLLQQPTMTRPRNARRVPNARPHERFEKSVNALNTHITALQDRVLRAHEVVIATQRSREQERLSFLSETKQKAWKSSFEASALAEHLTRPSDKTFPVRYWGLLDREIWLRDEMRAWYEKVEHP
ncbi:unnamed protein product, partial [Phaeothamnion confervicola]